jgi:hypothetical protein
MWEPRSLITLWAFTACYRDSFTFTFISVSRKNAAKGAKLLLACSMTLFIYLINVALNSKTIVDDELERARNGALFYLKGMRNKYVNQYSRSRSRDVRSGPPQYPEILTTVPQIQSEPLCTSNKPMRLD